MYRCSIPCGAVTVGTVCTACTVGTVAVANAAVAAGVGAMVVAASPVLHIFALQLIGAKLDCTVIVLPLLAVLLHILLLPVRPVVTFTDWGTQVLPLVLVVVDMPYPAPVLNGVTGV